MAMRAPDHLGPGQNTQQEVPPSNDFLRARLHDIGDGITAHAALIEAQPADHMPKLLNESGAIAIEEKHFDELLLLHEELGERLRQIGQYALIRKAQKPSNIVQFPDAFQE